MIDAPDHYPLLPSQYAEMTCTRAGTEPERRLLLAILTDAIVTFQARAASPRRGARREFEEAARWLFSEDRTWPCSFVNVCEALGIEPAPLRRALIEWRQRHDATARVRAARRRLLAGKDLRATAAAC
jgi:hypothetical protein